VTYYIVEPCIDLLDKSCVEVCPVDCIHFEEGVDRMEYIDPDECIACGACEPVCPVTAIFAEDDLPEDQKEFAEINTNWFKDPDAVRARINELKPPA
jgi:NAD-dependent dihydropyrimidine dehydrogenase PreA subunit